MPVVLSHNTALEILRAVPPQANVLAPVDEGVEAAALRAPKPHELLEFSRRCSLSAATVHALASRGHRQSRARGLSLHSTNAELLPAEGLLQLGPDLLVSGPELCFIQMTRKVSLVGSAVLGHELCGSYSHFSRLISGFYERPELTSVASIDSLMCRLGSFYGLARAREALAFVRDGSRSPMETVVSCELFLPTDVGGFGLAPPRLNYEVALDDVASQITGTSCCCVDVAYPDQLFGLEYDSAEFHADPAKDRRRREALQHMGWRIVTVDLERMASYDELRKAIALVASAVPRRPGKPFSSERGRELHGRLLRATRCGLGLNGALFGVPVPNGLIRTHVRA